MPLRPSAAACGEISAHVGGLQLFDTFDRTGAAEFPFHRQVVFRALCEAVPAIPGMKIERQDELAARLDVSVGMSAFSWGERVAISVTSTGPSSSSVGVASGANTIFGSATVHGKNRKNVAQIIAKTSDILKLKGTIWSAELGPAETPQSGASGSLTDELMKLADLQKQGLLTEEEFHTAKAHLLAR
jgi:hypothetical protein